MILGYYVSAVRAGAGVLISKIKSIYLEISKILYSIIAGAISLLAYIFGVFTGIKNPFGIASVSKPPNVTQAHQEKPFSHSDTIKNFWKLLSKYKLQTHFSIIIVLSIALEAIVPLYTFGLYSQWEEMVVEKNMSQLWYLFNVIGWSTIARVGLITSSYVMWRYLLALTRHRSSTEANNSFKTPAGMAEFVNSGTSTNSAVQNAPTAIMNEVGTFMNNLVPLYRKSIQTMCYATIGTLELIRQGLTYEAVGIVVGSVVILRAAGMFNNKFDRANREEFEDQSQAIMILNEMRSTANMSSPNASILNCNIVQGRVDNLLVNASSRYNATGIVSFVTWVLDDFTDRFLTLVVLGRVYFGPGAKLSYSSFGSIVRTASRLSSMIVGWSDFNETWSRMHISLNNVEAVQKEVIEQARTSNPNIRQHYHNRYATGQLGKDKDGNVAVQCTVSNHTSKKVLRRYAQISPDASCLDSSEYPSMSPQPLVVMPGSYIHLVGHNGSGKSTLAQVLSGEIPFPSMSENGEPYTTLQIKQQRIIPHFVQSECKALSNHNLSLWAFICYFWPHKASALDTSKPVEAIKNMTELPVPGRQACSRDEIEREIYSYLREMNFLPNLKLEKDLHQYLHMAQGAGLSGGEVGKLYMGVFLAIAKFAGIDVLVLDEVTAGLDMKTQKQYIDILNTFRKNNPSTSIFEVTHSTTNTSIGLNQKDKQIWVIHATDNDSEPSLKTFVDFEAFEEWAASTAAQKFIETVTIPISKDATISMQSFEFKNPLQAQMNISK